MRKGNYRGMVIETKSRVSVLLVLFVGVGICAVAGEGRSEDGTSVRRQTVFGANTR